MPIHPQLQFFFGLFVGGVISAMECPRAIVLPVTMIPPKRYTLNCQGAPGLPVPVKASVCATRAFEPAPDDLLICLAGYRV